MHYYSKQRKETLFFSFAFLFLFGVLFHFLYAYRTSRETLFSPPEEQVEKAEKIVVPLIRVVDGDTLKVFFQGKKERVRLIGINSPESVKPNEKPECFGVASKKHLEQMLQNQEMVLLEFDDSQGRRDRFGRLLAYGYLPNGESIEEVLLDRGYACEYRYRSDYRYKEKYKQIEKEAQKQKKGLWDNCSFICK